MEHVNASLDLGFRSTFWTTHKDELPFGPISSGLFGLLPIYWIIV